ncbi:MAG TPA: lysophospholipid acyltransferase family protein [Xanthobacteraceae bacterium]|nr:lysophospholipid acyltransferase family protein [Xanthobacteraceae bacterium]
MLSLKRIGNRPRVQKVAGQLAAAYLRFVWKTNSFAIDPVDIYERMVPDLPLIVAMWHGQHFMTPFFRRGHRATVLISRHRDGEVNAVAAERLGLETIRGSGTSGADFHRKGGVAGFRAMVDALADGCSVALTADVPKVSRVAGRGIVQLARASGRPIYPVAVATSRRIQMQNWDRSVINLPFGRFAIAVGEPVRVVPDADDAALETARRLLEAELNDTTDKAYGMVDGSAKDWRRRRTIVTQAIGRFPASSFD